MFPFVRNLAAGLTVCVLSGSAWAGIGFQPALPEELQMKAEPGAPGAAAVILYRQVDRDDNGRTSHEDNYLRVKILTEEGRKQANIEIQFAKGYEDVTNIRGRSIRPDGSVAEYQGKVFEKELVKGKGIKYIAKTFTLPDVEVGSIIEYFYTVDLKEQYIFDSHWILSNELFTKKARFSLKPYVGTYDRFSLRWSWHSIPPGTEPKEGPDHIIRMEAANIPAFPLEDYMPPPDELRARVDFIYERGIAEREQDKFWRSVGKSRDGAMESFVDKRKAMEQAVSQIVSQSDPPEVKLRKIYDRVQQIRNTSYEIRKTAQEEKRDKEKAAENVEDVWKRGYGDGVQLTWLFLGLVRAAGFEAYGCWVSSRNRYFFSPVTMESAKLNENVVLVKLNGKDLYFDPGGLFTPFGLLTWWETAATGLRLDKDGGVWIKTTLPEAHESRIERKGVLKLSETGDLEGKVSVTYVGLEAMYHRREEHHADEVERKKFLEERLTSQIPVGAEAELVNKPDWDSSETPLVAEFNLKIPGWATGAGRRVILPGAIFTNAERGVFEHADRVHPIYFEYPYEKSDDITIELPLGWLVSSVPPAQDVNGKVVTYSAQVEKVGGNLRLTRKLMIDVLLIDRKYYTPLRNFFQAVRTSDGVQVVVQPGELHANN